MLDAFATHTLYNKKQEFQAARLQCGALTRNAGFPRFWQIGLGKGLVCSVFAAQQHLSNGWFMSMDSAIVCTAATDVVQGLLSRILYSRS